MNSNSNKTLVSVIIPFYKSNETIFKAIKSASNQKGCETEVIVICDGDRITDEKTLDFIKQQNNIKIINKTENCGVAKARNCGVENARGKYVAFLDSDDWWAEDKLKKQLMLLENYKNESPKICFTGRQLFSYEGEKLNRYINAPREVRYGDLLKTNSINCSSVLIKKELAKAYPMECDNLHEDYICWLRILKTGGFAAGIDEPLLNYRMSKNSKSGNKIKSAIMTYKVYKKVGIGFLDRIRYILAYTFNGIRKYRS